MVIAIVAFLVVILTRVDSALVQSVISQSLLFT
jgi:hypothetical protein